MFLKRYVRLYTNKNNKPTKIDHKIKRIVTNTFSGGYNAIKLRKIYK